MGQVMGLLQMKCVGNFGVLLAACSGLMSSGCAAPWQDVCAAIAARTMPVQDVRRSAGDYSEADLTCMLGTAVRVDSPEIAMELIDRGAKPGGVVRRIDFNSEHARLREVNQEGCDGDPLRIATRHGRLEMVRLLLDKGADPSGLILHAEDPFLLYDSNTALHEAARVDEAKIAELLISRGARVDATNRMLRTPLHVAAANRKVQMAKFLISQGANPNAADIDGGTPLNVASENDEATIQILVQAGGKMTNPDEVQRRTEQRLREYWETIGVADREAAEADERRKIANRELFEHLSKPVVLPGMTNPQSGTVDLSPRPSGLISGPSAAAPQTTSTNSPSPNDSPRQPAAVSPSDRTRGCSATTTPTTLPIEREASGRVVGAARAVLPAAPYLGNVCLVGKVDGKTTRYQYRCSVDSRWVFVQQFIGAPNHPEDCIQAEFAFSQ